MNVLQAVYEYPPKLSRAERQVKAAHDIEEHRKMQRNMYKNILLGVVIIIIGAVFASAVFAKVLLILLGACNCSVGGLMYWYYLLSRDADVTQGYTKTTLNTLSVWGFLKAICTYAFTMRR